MRGGFDRARLPRLRSSEREDYTPVWIDEVRARTDGAVLCAVDGREIWIPLSNVEDADVTIPGVMQVRSWLARKENLPEHEGDDPLPNPSGPITMFVCRPKQDPGLGQVTTKAFGRGTLLRIEGDKSVVRFADGKVRTLASRYVENL
jgi:hypothetical protein